MAGLFHGHLLEFPRIRVDCFTPPPPAHRPRWTLPDPFDPKLPCIPAPNAQYYLLTHVHSDHLVGLTNDFTGNIICSPDTKRMLLRLEAEKDREHLRNGVREVKRRKYEGLAARSQIIETLDYGQSKVVHIPEPVTITLLDANHCPGSAMFLVQNSTKAILHTGDVRADLTFRQALRRCPQLQAFFPSAPKHPASDDFPATRQLDRIYLDTSAFMGTGDMPQKEPVIDALVTQMSLYPEDTVFFINAWCFGWEEVVMEVARHFNQPVHADRYKRSIYGAVQSNPFLLNCTTDDPRATRFHVCDRFGRCEMARNRDVVQVVLVEAKSTAWELQNQQRLNELNNAALGEGKWPMQIEVPIARHSPLPELQELVKMFKPAAVSPNTLVPQHNGLDYLLFADLLRVAVSNETYDKMLAERDLYFATSTRFGRAWLARTQGFQAELLALVLADSQNTMASWSNLDDGLAMPQRDNRGAWVLDQAMRIAGSSVQTPSPSNMRSQGTPANAARGFHHVQKPVRTSPSSSPTLPTGSPRVKKEATALPPPGTSANGDAAPSTPSPSRNARPATSSARVSLCSSNGVIRPEASLGAASSRMSAGETRVCEAASAAEKVGASTPPAGRHFKTESSRTSKSQPSRSTARPASRGLKRERRESSYRVNIAHLGDLASARRCGT